MIFICTNKSDDGLRLNCNVEPTGDSWGGMGGGNCPPVFLQWNQKVALTSSILPPPEFFEESATAETARTEYEYFKYPVGSGIPNTDIRSGNQMPNTDIRLAIKYQLFDK